MADIESGGGGGKHGGGKPKTKKQSTRVDFTPMVDLGFLLITFFMLTTTMSKPKTMEITFPVDKKDETAPDLTIKESQAFTIILGEKDRIYYYQGMDSVNMQTTNFGPNGIRKILLDANRKLNASVDSIPILKEQVKKGIITDSVYKYRAGMIKNKKGSLIVLIKPSDESRYKNLIDILDEMSICSIGSYSIVEITPLEKKIVSEAVIQ